MTEEELQLLITMDDPEFGPEEDTFKHQQARNSLEYWHVGLRITAVPPHVYSPAWKKSIGHDEFFF